MRYPKTAERLSQAIAEARITQQELADMAKINKSSISHYVNGTHEPGNKAAFAMSHVLGVNPLWLMGLDVGMHHSDPTKITMELSDFEEQIIHAFRGSSTDTQAAVCAVLGLKGDIALPRAKSINL